MVIHPLTKVRGVLTTPVKVGVPVNIVSNATNGRNIIHNIDLRLKADSSVKADTYKTTLQFEAVQK